MLFYLVIVTRKGYIYLIVIVDKDAIHLSSNLGPFKIFIYLKFFKLEMISLEKQNLNQELVYGKILNMFHTVQSILFNPN